MAQRRRSRPPVADLPVLRSGWPSGLALLDEGSLGVLETLAEEPPAGSLVVFVSEYADVAADAAMRVAAGVAGAGSPDLQRVEPAGERWTVAELEQLAASLRRFPLRRHVVVLDGVERMDRRGLDRLLVLLEEPPSPLLVLMCVSGRAALPGTIRGRASMIVELSVLSAAERVRALEAKGVASAVAAESVALAGSLPSLAGLLAVEATVRGLARVAFDPELDRRRPAVSAARRVAAVATLAEVLAAVRAGADEVVVSPKRFDELSPEARRLARLLFGVWVDRRRAALVDRVADADTDGATVRAIEASLAALDVFVSRLLVPVTPLTALVALGADSAPTRRQ